MISLTGSYGRADIMIDVVEDECIQQIKTFLDHVIMTDTVAKIMPDTHGGAGSVIGFTAPLTSIGICSNIVGVDEGCGMHSWLIESDQPLVFEEIDKQIRQVVPLGTSRHQKPIATMENDFCFDSASKAVSDFVDAYNRKFETDFIPPVIDYVWWIKLCRRISAQGTDLEKTADNQIGTLGGGNHFIEIGKNNDGGCRLTVHSGSRNIGKRCADYFQKIAQLQLYNPDSERDLAFLTGQDAMDYFVALNVMQQYAGMNREVIGDRISEATGLILEDEIESVHNFIDFRDMIIRKGAIRSYEGERMIIPFNMRDGMFVCEGRSNPDWNYSAPHGAGRVMSRTEARRTLKLEDYQKQMDGIYSTSICADTLDEAPDTYKKMDLIANAIGPTAHIIDRFIPVYNLKSSDDGSSFGRKKKKEQRSNDNSTDAIWQRVKSTLPKGVITPENESKMRVLFEADQRAFCKTWRSGNV